MISIILTCYKQEKFIDETILSVINQSYKNRELLVGDDSPDDDCRNIISKYIKKYPDKIKAWHHNPNKGIVNNMQFLIEQRNKKSEYIAFLEGDDRLFPKYLEKKLEIFNKFHDVKLVYNELTTIDEYSKIILGKELKSCGIRFCKKGKISYEKLINQFYYKSRSSIMIKSEILGRYSIFSEILGTKTLISDIYFFNQIAHNENIYGIEEPLVYYRICQNSASRNMQSSIIIYLDIIKYINYLFEQGFINEIAYKNQICKNFLFICIVSLKKCLGMGMFKTIKLFGIECYKALRIRYKRLLNH